MVVTVRYVFGLARGMDGRDTMTLELPRGTTVFEVLQRLGVSSLELHAAVNGQSAADGTVLRDGDEVTLIPAIQGGSMRGEVMRTIVSSVIAVGLGLVATSDVLAQSRVVVPIIIQRPTAAPAPARGTGSIQVTIQRNSGAGGVSGGAAPRNFAGTPANLQTIRIVTQGTQGVPQPAAGRTTETRVTIQDTTGVAGVSGIRSVNGFASSSTTAQTLRIITHETPGSGTAPGSSREIQLFVEGEPGRIDTPLVILAE